MSVPRMRIAEEVMREIKAQDPDTAITVNYIRTLIHTNKIPVTQVGRKKLVNLDIAMEYIANGVYSEPMEDVEVGKIRRICG